MYILSLTLITQLCLVALTFVQQILGGQTN